jgi:hypothetical protein
LNPRGAAAEKDGASPSIRTLDCVWIAAFGIS